MVKGLLADVNTRGPVDYLVQHMRAEPWAEFWRHLGLTLFHFEDVGLTPTSTDLEIWHRCQADQLVFITNNRNARSPDSLELTIREYNQPDSLPVFTIANLDKFRTSRPYAERLLERLYDYLLRIDSVRGTGRLYLP
jgi:hypothetical protein